MKMSRWIKIAGWTALTVVLVVGAVILVERAEPNVNSYQLRRFAKKLHIKLPPPDPLSDAEKTAANAEAAAWKVKFLAEFPALQATPHPVPPEENGFLMLYELGNLSISAEFEEILRNPGTCDPEAAQRCLAEHAGIVAQAEKIGSLRTRSSIGMPDGYKGFFPARPAKQCCDILLLKASLAAKAGNEEEALRCVNAVGNLAEHLHAVESPTLLTETVAILMDRGRQSLTLKTLLPPLGKSVDLNRWQAELGRLALTPADFAKVLRGEWDASADFMMFPLLVLGNKQGEFPDGEAIARSHSSWCHDAVTTLATVDLAGMKGALVPLSGSGLSEEGRNILSMLTGVNYWIDGYIRAAVVTAQHRAAIELLILEKSGAELSETDAKRVFLDPLTGDPFDFDPIKRELSVRPLSGRDNVDPLTLPW